MEIKIVKKERKHLLSREEIQAAIFYEKTPSNRQLQEELSKQLKKEIELVVIKHIYPKFGSNESKAIVYLYDNKEALVKFEPKKKEKKGAAPVEKKE